MTNKVNNGNNGWKSRFMLDCNIVKACFSNWDAPFKSISLSTKLQNLPLLLNVSYSFEFHQSLEQSVDLDFDLCVETRADKYDSQ